MPAQPTSAPPVPRRALAFALAFAALSSPLDATASGAIAPERRAPVVVEGDILVAPDAVSGLRGTGSGAAASRWSHGEVPYRIDGALDAARHRAIEEAVARWNDAGIVTLLPIDPAGPVPTDHLVFQPGEGCASWVGRQGGAQAVWVGPRCAAGSVMHEIGHALGLEHEHTRADRDSHVRVLWENIVPGKRHNFELAPRGTRSLGAYDIDSIMHYGPANFSALGLPTLEPLDPALGARMGQRDAPSAGDLAAVARLYASDLALDARLDDETDAREVILHVTNLHDQGAHDVRTTLRVGRTSGAAGEDGAGAGDSETPPGFSVDASSDAGWRCDAASDRVDCRLARLDGGGASRLVLTLDAPVAGAALRASVRSRTPDLDPGNNGERSGGEASRLAVPALGAAFADAFLLADDAVTAGGGEASGGGALGWIALGALAPIARRRRADRRYCVGC